MTPSELARELGVSPKRVRDALRAKYGKLPRLGDRWHLDGDQVQYVRARFR